MKLLILIILMFSSCQTHDSHGCGASTRDIDNEIITVSQAIEVIRSYLFEHEQIRRSIEILVGQPLHPEELSCPYKFRHECSIGPFNVNLTTGDYNVMLKYSSPTKSEKINVAIAHYSNQAFLRGKLEYYKGKWRMNDPILTEEKLTVYEL